MAQKKKKKKRKLTPFGKFLRGLYLTAMILSALIVSGFAIWTVTVPPPTVEQPAPTVPAITDDPNTPENEADRPPAQQGLRRKEHAYTFLLVARDQVDSNTDTMIVASYDADNDTAGLVSIPRDTLVDRKTGPYRAVKINTVYANGEAVKAGGGIPELKDTVSDLLGIPIDYYVMVDVSSFVKIVDKVGGVDFDVPVHMDYYDPTQNLKIYYEKGMHYGLTGKQILEIARCRQNTIWHDDGTYDVYAAYPDGDIGRTRTQQALLKAIAKKLLSWGSLTKINEFITIFNESVETNIPLNAMLFFGSDALAGDVLSNLNTATFPGDGEVTYRGLEYCYQYDVPGSLALINTMLNPYTTDVTSDMVDMLQVK